MKVKDLLEYLKQFSENDAIFILDKGECVRLEKKNLLIINNVVEQTTGQATSH